MENRQSNSARLVYTLKDYLQKPDNNSCKLKNGFYFQKVSRKDEIIHFTETDVLSFVRTTMFLHVFQLSPCNSLLDIINSGEANYLKQNISLIHVNLIDSIEILDKLFGKNFSCVASRVIIKWFEEYKKNWQYFPFNRRVVQMPSADDYVKLHKFFNVKSSKHTQAILHLLNNTTDGKLPLQGMKKILCNKMKK